MSELAAKRVTSEREIAKQVLLLILTLTPTLTRTLTVTLALALTLTLTLTLTRPEFSSSQNSARTELRSS